MHLGYFLKLKGEFFYFFLTYKVVIEKQYRKQLQRLRIDNGGECVNNSFATYGTTQGI